ncbi:MAG: hypothetical protein IJZ87_05560 [Bacteroidales bacterium]|nr:hypothetical protein [Bacteroidales bacterium]
MNAIINRIKENNKVIIVDNQNGIGTTANCMTTLCNVLSFPFFYHRRLNVF